MKKDIDQTEIFFFFFKKKKLDCKFIKINISKENCDADYEIGRTQTFTSELKNKKNKRIRKRK